MRLTHKNFVSGLIICAIIILAMWVFFFMHGCEEKEPTYSDWEPLASYIDTVDLGDGQKLYLFNFPKSDSTLKHAIVDSLKIRMIWISQTEHKK